MGIEGKRTQGRGRLDKEGDEEGERMHAGHEENSGPQTKRVGIGKRIWHAGGEIASEASGYER